MLVPFVRAPGLCELQPRRCPTQHRPSRAGSAYPGSPDNGSTPGRSGPAGWPTRRRSTRRLRCACRDQWCGQRAHFTEHLGRRVPLPPVSVESTSVPTPRTSCAWWSSAGRAVAGRVEHASLMADTPGEVSAEPPPDEEVNRLQRRTLGDSYLGQAVEALQSSGSSDALYTPRQDARERVRSTEGNIPRGPEG